MVSPLCFVQPKIRAREIQSIDCFALSGSGTHFPVYWMWRPFCSIEVSVIHVTFHSSRRETGVCKLGKCYIILTETETKTRAQRKHLKHFIKSMRGHIHVLKWNINTKYIYMYKLWQRQIEAYQVLSKNVNSQKTGKDSIKFISQMCCFYQR